MQATQTRWDGDCEANRGMKEVEDGIFRSGGSRGEGR